MRTLQEIRNTPVGLLSDDEISQLSLEGQAYARLVRARMTVEAACPGHEAISESTWEESRRGWHRLKCKHCGKNMSYDSGG